MDPTQIYWCDESVRKMCDHKYIEKNFLLLCITNVKSLGYFPLYYSFFLFPRCLNHQCLNMNSTWTGAPGCINDSLLTGLEFVDGFQSYFFVKRWTMHQLVNSCSQSISSVIIFELNIDHWEYFSKEKFPLHFQKFKSWHHFQGRGQDPVQMNWLFKGMDGDWALNPLELMDMSCILDRMAVRGAGVVFCYEASNG